MRLDAKLSYVGKKADHVSFEHDEWNQSSIKGALALFYDQIQAENRCSKLVDVKEQKGCADEAMVHDGRCKIAVLVWHTCE